VGAKPQGKKSILHFRDFIALYCLNAGKAAPALMGEAHCCALGNHKSANYKGGGNSTKKGAKGRRCVKKKKRRGGRREFLEGGFHVKKKRNSSAGGKRKSAVLQGGPFLKNVGIIEVSEERRPKGSIAGQSGSKT